VLKALKQRRRNLQNPAASGPESSRFRRAFWQAMRSIQALQHRQAATDLTLPINIERPYRPHSQVQGLRQIVAEALERQMQSPMALFLTSRMWLTATRMPTS
jgi:hypothetical protein